MTWEIIREILNHHRSHSDTDWALPESELVRLENLYNKLQPKDIVSKYIWLFNKHWPEFPEGFKYESDESENRYEQQQGRIDIARQNAITIFLRELGLDQTIDLRKKVKEYWLLGDASAKVIINQVEVFTVCNCLYDNDNLIGFIHSFIFRKSIIEGFEWIKLLFKKLQENRFSNKALANVLIPLNQNQELWDFVSSLDKEIQNEYWRNMRPNFYHVTDFEKEIGINMLLKYKRFFSAIDIVSHFTNAISSHMLSEILKSAATEDSNDPPRFSSYEIERIFEELDKRTDFDKSALINLEWLYLPILDSYGTRRNPKILEEELARNPAFFIEVLKLIYTPEDKMLLKQEREDTSDEIIQNRAKQAYHLLHSWKTIPGIREDNSIDELVLKNWIIKVRKLAEAASRLNVADSEIGKLLAQYPENVSQWPQETIFEIIEGINTDSLKNSYSSAMFNKRSFSSRGVFDGGDIEREKAIYFEKLANNFNNKYPNVADIFKRMHQYYLADAKRMDEEAERNRLDY